MWRFGPADRAGSTRSGPLPPADSARPIPAWADTAPAAAVVAGPREITVRRVVPMATAGLGMARMAAVAVLMVLPVPAANAIRANAVPAGARADRTECRVVLLVVTPSPTAIPAVPTAGRTDRGAINKVARGAATAGRTCTPFADARSRSRRAVDWWHAWERATIALDRRKTMTRNPNGIATE